VFSTLHTNDAAGATTRLLDMGIEPFLVASSVEGIMAQRLVRLVCTHCGTTYEPDPRSLPADFETPESKTLVMGQGCRECRHSGYSGRVGLFELIMMDEDTRELIVQRASAGRILQHCRKNGLKVMREDGWDKVRAGMTTIEEVLRVTKV
jgi:general secretion pathway protein E